MDGSSTLEQMYARQQNSVVEKPEGDKKVSRCAKFSPCMFGALTGLLLGGIVLATILTLFTQDRATTTASVSSTISVTVSSKYTVDRLCLSLSL